MPTVLFVCVENTFRSVMAEALFNAGAPPGWRAISAGVDAKERVNPVAQTLMAEVGLDVSGKVPQQVTAEMVRGAARVVTFGCQGLCPADSVGKSEDWPLPGSTGKTDQQLRGIREEMRRRVLDLILRLQNRKD